MKQEYEDLVNRYVEKLLEGTRHTFNFWVGNNIGGVASIGFNIFMTFDEIRYCVDNNVSVDKYEEFQEYVVDQHFKLPKEQKYKDYITEKYLRSQVMQFKNWLVWNPEEE